MKLFKHVNSIRILSLFCLCLVLASCASSKETKPTDTEVQTTTAPISEPDMVTDFKIGFIAEDSLNPFKAKTAANCAVISLMFDSLFSNDNSFKPNCLIADSYKTEDEELTVILKQGIVFSDGSALTAEDVAYSFELARTSPLYSQRLSAFKSVICSDSLTLKFILSHKNPYAVACLDFPIISSDSYDSPIGSGRYLPLKLNNTNYLVPNKNRSNFATDFVLSEESFDVIELYDISSPDGLSYRVQKGEFDFVFDNLSSGKSGISGTSIVPVPLNNMVFLGINSSSYSATAFPVVRRALRAAVDGSALVESVYGNLADASSLPFNPNWYALDAVAPTDSTSAEEYLEQAGYKRHIDSDSENSYYITLNLIVNTESTMKVEIADKIAEQLATSGIKTNVKKYDFNSYIKAIEQDEYDLFIGEIRLTPDMDLSEILSNADDYGLNVSAGLLNSYTSFLDGTSELSDFSAAFVEASPFVPICFRYGAAIFSRELNGTQDINSGNIFSGIENWSFSGADK